MLLRVRSNHASYETLEGTLQECEFSLQGKKIMEIGSGWAPVMPYLMIYFGKAKSVTTFDINQHFSKKNINRLNQIFESYFEIQPNSEKNKPYAIPKTVEYFPKTNIINAELPEVDLVFSRFVLEHVTPKDIKAMHQKFKKDLKPGTKIVHFISPGDHRAYLDNNLSLQEFLKYSDNEWQKKQTKFDYHNRLRLPEYLSIFRESQLEVMDLKFDCPKPDSETFQKFKAVPLHNDFINFTDEELTAGSINVVLQT